MTLTSFSFLCFFAVVLVLYYIIPSKCQPYFLLLSSLVFYHFAATDFTIIYIVVSILSIYFGSRFFEKQKIVVTENQNLKEQCDKKSKRVLIAVLFINIGMLVALKYMNFFIVNINILGELFHLDYRINSVRWIASLGISFYTLQMISYLLDCYWGTIAPQHNFFKFALFACYFPQMISGPISRYSQIGEQLCEKHTFSYKNVTFGLQRMAWGFFKKLVISERLAVIINTIYGNSETYCGLYIWIGTFAFVLQLYTDFSGCMDIVIGVSECLGVMLPENFNTPFFSRTIQEFWQRWHITLGTWLKDYIMYPILKSELWIAMGDKLKKRYGKKISKKVPMYLGMLILWFAMGLWHGTGWKYIVGEGFWFWILIVLGQLLNPMFKKIIEVFKINTECFSWHLLQMIRTFLCFSVGMVFFRANSFTNAVNLLRDSLKLNLSIHNPGVTKVDFFILIVSISILFIVSILHQKGNVREILANQNLYFRWPIYLMLVWTVILFGAYGEQYNSNGFIYQFF